MGGAKVSTLKLINSISGKGVGSVELKQLFYIVYLKQMPKLQKPSAVGNVLDTY